MTKRQAAQVAALRVKLDRLRPQAVGNVEATGALDEAEGHLINAESWDKDSPFDLSEAIAECSDYLHVANDLI